MADSKSDSIIGGHFATKPLDNPLWQYACQVYSKKGVEAALLVLQDVHGADINLILQALWLASEGQQWTKECIPEDYSAWMDAQVLPLRQMRRSMKIEWVEKRGAQYEGFRQQVKKLELKAEQYALGMLFLQSNNTSAEEQNEAELLANSLHNLAEYFTIEPDRMLNILNLINNRGG